MTDSLGGKAHPGSGPSEPIGPHGHNEAANKASGGGHQPVVGQVTATAVDSITVQPGKTKGHAAAPAPVTLGVIAGQTVITKGDVEVDISAVAIGDWVTVKQSGGTATRIAVHDSADAAELPEAP
jgi:hypothetical protein